MRYKISFALCTGTGHLRQGLPCQDRVAVVRTEEVAACVLADGAGSCRHSDTGADCVTKAAAGMLAAQFERLWSLGPQARGEKILWECMRTLQDQSYPLHDMSCTLLFCASHQDGRYLAGHLGDGIMLLELDDTLSVFSMPENGEQDNETFFVTGVDAPERLRLYQGCWTGTGTLFLMSDGTAESLYQYSDRTPAVACRIMASWLRKGEEDVISQALERNMQQKFAAHTLDDMSLILLSWSEERDGQGKNCDTILDAQGE